MFSLIKFNLKIFTNKIFLKSKYLFAFMILLSSNNLNAKEDLVDGFSIRLGLNSYNDDIKIDGIGNISQKNKFINSKLLLDYDIFNNEFFGNYQRGDEIKGYFSIKLKDNLINSFMFRGANIDFIYNGLVLDLPPAKDNNEMIYTHNNELILRQDVNLRKKLINEFFNNNDKAFAYSNDYWSLSSDIQKNVLLFGYSFGFFIPIGSEHRFFINSYGIGLGFYSYNIILNLCEKYKLSELSKDKLTDEVYYQGTCEGKTKIDEATLKGYYTTLFQSLTLWQWKSKDAIYQIGKIENSQGTGSGTSNLIKHKSNISTNVIFDSIEFITYTYRF